MNLNLTGTIILSCWIALGLYWLVTAFFQKKTNEGKNFGFGNMVYALSMLASVALLLISPQVSFLNLIIIRVSLFVNIISITLSIIGVLVLIYSRTVLGTNWSKDVLIKKNHELITKGPYRYVRHPIYLGILMLYLGTTIAIGNLGTILGFLILLASLIVKLKQEEVLMTKQFKKKYLKYKKKTKALVPWII